MKIWITIILVIFSSQPCADMEDWYTYWSIGISENTYPKDVQDAFDQAESQPGVDRIEISIDMLGFYWPMSNHKTLVGGVISGTSDTLTNNGYELSLRQYLYAISVMHFPGKEIGEGVFLRGDFGFSKAVIDTNYIGDASSETGTGMLIGIGYGIPVSSESRILLSINYTSKEIESDNTSAIMFNIGGLW